MNIFLRIFSSVLAFLLMFGPNSNNVHMNGEPDDINDQQSVETINQLLSHPDPISADPKKADLEYFRAVTESTTYDEIICDIGPADYITGSGIITYHWKLDDDLIANVAFNYNSQVLTLIIVKDGEVMEGIVW